MKRKEKMNEKWRGGVQVENPKKGDLDSTGVIRVENLKRSSKWRKSQRAIQSMKSSHPRDEVESKVLFERIKIVGYVCLLREGFESQIKMTPNVHCSNISIYLYVCIYVNSFFIYGIIIIPFQWKALFEFQFWLPIVCISICDASCMFKVAF